MALAYLPVDEHDLLSRGEVRPEFPECFGRLFRELQERTAERAPVTEALEQDDVVDRERKERVCFAPKVGDAILDGGVHDGIAVEFVGDGLVVPLEDILVDAVVLIKQFQRRFEALRDGVDRVPVQAFVIHTVDLEDHAEVSGLCKKHMLIDEPVEIHLLVE